MIIFIKHIDIEGLAAFSEFFQYRTYFSRIVSLQDGETIPCDWEDIEGVISLGGPMNVYEEDKYPFLKEEDAFLKEIVEREIPFIGICLGAQLLAKACGAKIKKAPQKEIGFYSATLTGQGEHDVLFGGIAKNMDVFQWHEDTFDLPEGAKLLSTSSGCAHQAFKVGPCAYGLQFHVEITGFDICQWADAYLNKDNSHDRVHVQAMLDDYQKRKEHLAIALTKIYHNFLSMIRVRQEKILSGAL